MFSLLLFLFYSISTSLGRDENIVHLDEQARLQILRSFEGTYLAGYLNDTAISVLRLENSKLIFEHFVQGKVVREFELPIGERASSKTQWANGLQHFEIIESAVSQNHFDVMITRGHFYQRTITQYTLEISRANRLISYRRQTTSFHRRHRFFGDWVMDSEAQTPKAPLLFEAEYAKIDERALSHEEMRELSANLQGQSSETTESLPASAKVISLDEYRGRCSVFFRRRR